MKRIFYVAICLFMASCSSPKEKEVKASNVEVADNEAEPISELTTASTLSYDEKTVSTTKSNDWDTALIEYDEYIDKYIEFMKKGKAGDQTAMLEAVELMSKAQSAGEKLKAVNDGELTIAQLARFTKIQTKLLKTAESE